MKHHYLSLIILSVFSLISSCQQKNADHLIAGWIDEGLYAAVEEFDLKNQIVGLASEGGENKFAAPLAELIANENVSLEVVMLCSSACAEFLLPAANKIKFLNEPMIGFHWSPILNEQQRLRAVRENAVSCPPDSSYYSQRNLFKNKNLNLDFWKEIEHRLILKYYSSNFEKCNLNKRKFVNDLWFPTSKQLRDLWGLNFTGSVCADNFDACKYKINQTWEKGYRVVIGDTLHISEGLDSKCLLDILSDGCSYKLNIEYMRSKKLIVSDKKTDQ